jgi:hypothetical protein
MCLKPSIEQRTHPCKFSALMSDNLNNQDLFSISSKYYVWILTYEPREEMGSDYPINGNNKREFVNSLDSSLISHAHARVFKPIFPQLHPS